jgi:hypothetical protein
MNVPRLLIPFLVIAAISAGFVTRTSLTKPTTDTVFGSGGTREVECVVTGLKCKGTANFFTKLYDNVPGIASITTFATEHRAVFRYDPNMTTPEQIRTVMEQTITFRDGTSRQIFECQTMK